MHTQEESEGSGYIRITENHNLLYYNLPNSIVEKLRLSKNDCLEYDVRGEHFYIRKKGSESFPEINDNLFRGLRVERSITQNNTRLRTNLPKEVAQSLSIQKGDVLEFTLTGEVVIGKKKNKLTKNTQKEIQEKKP